MNTFNDLRQALICALTNKVDEWAQVGWVDQSEVEDTVDDLIEEIGLWEKEHGILKGISNPEMFEEMEV